MAHPLFVDFTLTRDSDIMIEVTASAPANVVVEVIDQRKAEGSLQLVIVIGIIGGLVLLIPSSFRHCFACIARAKDTRFVLYPR